MTSIIPDYYYDIFISYRQKDNKGDKWVSEFVEALKTELESTFKEEIDVYFDINPHDGLLETHDVDDSLKEKLKCLIFIPIVSRTYCDPKSFAWENEFKAFLKQASEDQYGLKLKLSSGNIAGRVLPIRIHDLDIEDTKLFESALGGMLRDIEFIYKEPGINRPLTADDDPKTNLNKTRYRNQINKVALAIKEIITAIKKHGQPTEKISENAGKAAAMSEFTDKSEKSLAILPFINDSPDEENSYFINGIMEEILNNLQKIKDLRVISRTSVEQYRNQHKSIAEIAEELDVNYIVEGSGQKYGNDMRLRTQLITADRETHLWGESYQQKISDAEDIFNIQIQIAKTIAEKLKAVITPQEKKLIEKVPTENLEAYDAYLKGQFYWRKLTPTDLDTAMQYFELAKEKDPDYALAYAGICDVWIGRQQGGWASPDVAGPKAFEAAMKALELDDTRAEVHYTLALMYTWGMFNWKAGEEAFKKAIELKATYPEARAYYSHLLNIMGRQQEAREQIELAIRQDPLNPLNISLYAIDLFFFRQYKDAVNEARKAIAMDNTSMVSYSALTYALYFIGEYGEMKDTVKVLFSTQYEGVFNDLDIKLMPEDHIEAIRLMAEMLVEYRKKFYVTPADISMLFAVIGDKDNALKFMEYAFEEHDPNLPYIFCMPVSDNLREEVRFQEIAKKMNLPYKL